MFSQEKNNMVQFTLCDVSNEQCNFQKQFLRPKFRNIALLFHDEIIKNNFMQTTNGKHTSFS